MSGGSIVPPSDVLKVIQEEVKEWHFHIYFLQNDAKAKQAALDLRDAVLRLRRDGAFVAVPLFRVNEGPMGPHPVGSYEIWCPIESFASVFSYLALHRGGLSVLIHPLTHDQRRDHEVRNAWMGPSFPLYLGTLPIRSDDIPVQYTTLGLGYSSTREEPSIEERKKLGAKVEDILRREKEAARAPTD